MTASPFIGTKAQSMHVPNIYYVDIIHYYTQSEAVNTTEYVSCPFHTAA